MTHQNEPTVMVTGANGQLGRQLLVALGEWRVRALVRSPQAAEFLRGTVSAEGLAHVEVHQCDYLDVEQLAALASDCCYVVHLVGIIRESAQNSFERVHERTTQALMQALKGSAVRRIGYLSLLGSSALSSNPCLATRARAEQMILEAGISALVLRTPMILGPGDYASRALRGRSGRLAFTFRSSSLEQPVYSGDVVRALVTDMQRSLSDPIKDGEVIEWAGPSSLSRAELQARADAILGRRGTLVSLPLGLGLALAWILEHSSGSPPVSRAMLKVLDHDDSIDPGPASKKLGVELTGLDEMLRICME